MARDVVRGLEDVVVLWCCCADFSRCRVPGAWVVFRVSSMLSSETASILVSSAGLFAQGFGIILSSCLATPVSMSAVLRARGVIVSPSSDKRRGKAAELSQFFKIHA